MPLVRISTIADRMTPEKKKKLCQEIHDVMIRNTTAPSEAVSIIIDEVPPQNWMMHQNMLNEREPSDFFKD